MGKSYMWHVLVVFSFSTTSLFAHQSEIVRHIDPTPEIEERSPGYYSQAYSWITEYIVDKHDNLLISNYDLYLINSLLYFSYARSCATCHVQQKAIPFLEMTWHAWRNITHTRRNPSRPIPFADPEKPDELYERFWSDIEQHCYWRTGYQSLLAQVLEQGILDTTRAVKSVESLRSQARLAGASGLLATSMHQESLKKYLSALHISAQPNNKPHKGITHIITHLIPTYAFRLFVNLDRMAEKSAEHLWDAMIAIQDCEILYWNELETIRAAFYYAHYLCLNMRLAQAGIKLLDYSTLSYTDTSIPEKPLMLFFPPPITITAAKDHLPVEA